MADPATTPAPSTIKPVPATPLLRQYRPATTKEKLDAFERAWQLSRMKGETDSVLRMVLKNQDGTLGQPGEPTDNSGTSPMPGNISIGDTFQYLLPDTPPETPTPTPTPATPASSGIGTLGTLGLITAAALGAGGLTYLMTKPTTTPPSTPPSFNDSSTDIGLEK